MSTRATSSPTSRAPTSTCSRTATRSQLDIYKKQKSQYEKLLKSIQDDKNYFSETDIDDQPYYYQYETYKSQVSQKAFDASPYQAAGYTDEQIKTMMEQNQSEVESLYYSTLQSISAKPDQRAEQH